MHRRLIAAAALSVTLAAAALAQVTFAPKRAENSSAVTRNTIKMNQVLTIAGMDVATEVEAEEVGRSTAGKRAADGTLRVEEKTEGVKFKLTVPGAALQFDSAKPDEGKSDNPMLQGIHDALKHRVGTSYTLVYGKDNRIAAVEGTEKIFEKAPPGALETLKQELEPERLKKALNEALSLLPDKAVAKGDRWERTHSMDIGGGQKLVFTSYLEYQGTVEKAGRMLDKISVFTAEVKYELDPNSPIPLKVVSSDLKISASTGTMLFDRDRGQVVENVSNLRIAGPMTFSVNGMELPGKVDLTIDISAVVGDK